MRSPSTRTVGEYAHILLRGGIVLICAAIAGGLAGWLAAEMTPKTYESQARLLIVAPGSATVSGARTSGLAGQLRAPSYRELATSDQLLMRVAAAQWPGIDPQTPPADLRERVVASIEPTNAVLTITTTGDTPQAAQQLSAALAGEMPKLVVEVDNLNGRAPYELKTIDAATDMGVTSPKLLTYTGLGAAVAVVFSAAALLAFSLLRNRVDDALGASNTLRSSRELENSQ